MRLHFLVLAIFLTLIVSCEKENQEDLSDTCGTANVSYSSDITPILTSNCTSCHNAQFASGGVQLDEYDQLKVSVDNGALLGAIKHDSGFSKMPQGQEKLPECNIALIEAWIEDGALEN